MHNARLAGRNRSRCSLPPVERWPSCTVTTACRPPFHQADFVVSGELDLRARRERGVVKLDVDDLGSGGHVKEHKDVLHRFAGVDLPHELESPLGGQDRWTWLELPTFVVMQELTRTCLLYTSPSPRDRQKSR